MSGNLTAEFEGQEVVLDLNGLEQAISDFQEIFRAMEVSSFRSGLIMTDIEIKQMGLEAYAKSHGISVDDIDMDAVSAEDIQNLGGEAYFNDLIQDFEKAGVPQEFISDFKQQQQSYEEQGVSKADFVRLVMAQLTLAGFATSINAAGNTITEYEKESVLEKSNTVIAELEAYTQNGEVKEDGYSGALQAYYEKHNIPEELRAKHLDSVIKTIEMRQAEIEAMDIAMDPAATATIESPDPAGVN